MSVAVPVTRKDLKGFHRDVRDVGLAASKAGWVGRRLAGGGWILHSPDQQVSMRLPHTANPSPANIRNLRQALGRWMAENTQEETVLGTLARAATNPEVWAELAEGPIEEESTPVTVEEPTPEAETPERTVVSVVPLWVPQGTGGGYTSRQTNKRTWSDGTEDYTCAHCGEAKATVRAMGPHWARKDHESVRATVGHRARYGRSTGRPPGRPPKPAETVDVQGALGVIRGLLATEQAEVEGLRKQVRSLEDTLAGVLQQRDEAIKRYEELRGNLGAVRDLLNPI